MSNIQGSPDNNNQYQITQYKITYSCDRKDCSNTATYKLKIRYLRPHGYFCTGYTEYLKDNGLIEAIVDDSIGKSKKERSIKEI